jgi:hypothetical protein
MALRSILFIIIGAIYLIYPNIFSRWAWKKNAVPSESVTKRYTLMMRLLGGVLIVIGIVLALVK